MATFTTPNRFDLLSEESGDESEDEKTPVRDYLYHGPQLPGSIWAWPFDLLPHSHAPQSSLQKLYEKITDDDDDFTELGYEDYNPRFIGWSPELLAKMDKLCKEKKGIFYFLHAGFEFDDYYLDHAPEDPEVMAKAGSIFSVMKFVYFGREKLE